MEGYLDSYLYSRKWNGFTNWRMQNKTKDLLRNLYWSNYMFFYLFSRCQNLSFSKMIKMVDKFMVQQIEFVVAKSYFMYAYCIVQIIASIAKLQ